MTLTDFFKQNNKCAMGYSGGVDSVYLLSEAIKCGVDIKPYFVRSQFTTERECDEAISFAASLGCEVTVIDVNVFENSKIVSNDNNRCYYCKKMIFERIINAAQKDGYCVVLEGTNASDDILDRPGFKAITELGVVSPLKLCGITKDMIRAELKKCGFSLWNKPASACLATRIPVGNKITAEELLKVKKAEDVLRDLGFSDFRVRVFSGAARIQLKSEQFPDALSLRNEIINGLKPYFSEILLDLKER